MKIGICGLGWVGGTIRDYFLKTEQNFSKTGHTLFLYDKYKAIGTVEGLNRADVIFVAVPTPYAENGYDDSAVSCCLDFIQDGKTIVIKSTVMPGST
jgi:UDP-glucose 6-dehydrogenase